MENSHLDGARVLVAKREKRARARLDQELREHGADVVDVNNGREVLSALVSDGPFDAVILDLAMPDLAGTDVVAMTRSAGLAVPFILLAPRDRPTPHIGADQCVTVLTDRVDAHTIVDELDHALVAPHAYDLSKCVFVACAACGRAHITDLWPPMPSLCDECADRKEIAGAPDDLMEDPYAELGGGD